MHYNPHTFQINSWCSQTNSFFLVSHSLDYSTLPNGTCDTFMQVYKNSKKEICSVNKACWTPKPWQLMQMEILKTRCGALDCWTLQLFANNFSWMDGMTDYCACDIGVLNQYLNRQRAINWCQRKNHWMPSSRRNAIYLYTDRISASNEAQIQGIIPVIFLTAKMPDAISSLCWYIRLVETN